MIDPRREAVVILDKGTGEFVDRTLDVDRYQTGLDGRTVAIVFRGNSRPYSFGPERVRIMRDVVQVAIPTGARVEVDGVIWQGVQEFWEFGRQWVHLFYGGENKFSVRPASKVRIVPNATVSPVAADVFGYWRDIVSQLPADHPLRRPYERLDFVHPESALSRYLMGGPIEFQALASAPIFPFRCNLSQREAVGKALTRSISVIEGPPGTGKTETILNLVANIISSQLGSVGVVSFNNAAVDNVREKLDGLGFGHVVAGLGRREKRENFFAGQARRNSEVASLVRGTPEAPSPERLADLDGRLAHLQESERTLAELRCELDAHTLERQHFERHVQHDEIPDLEGRPLLRKSSDRILDYLVDSELENVNGRPGLLRRLRRYFAYGSLRGLDPDDTGVVLRVQQAYYDRRIVELQGQMDRVSEELTQGDFSGLLEEHRALSTQTLHAALGARYGTLSRTSYSMDTYKLGTTFKTFAQDYPLILSTCHSLADSIGRGHLLDYLIIDEASQVDLLAAGLALSCCRKLVVVGDLKQLPHIADGVADGCVAPSAAYDYRQQNILSSLVDVYGDELPRTLLREHYRCDPAIIGFCNKMFYGGELVPYTTKRGERPMIVVRTAEGNHMRQHRGGGRSNRREVDVIAHEVIPEYCKGVASGNIGIATPYRRQAETVVNTLIEQVEADTVHKFQGRQKDVIILTTVLSDNWRGRTGLPFVDDPSLINVAVSRAGKKFILVTNNEMLPTSRHIRDLIGYIRYQHPADDVVDSTVISMFDLLYSKYSERLLPLAARLRNEMAYKSEDIIWTVLQDILVEDRYAHLTVSFQVLLRNLLVDDGRLTPRQAAYVGHRASVDFVVYNRVTNRPLLAIEVDGFASHENNPAQQMRDEIKNEIFDAHQMPLLRLPTTGSAEEERIRQALDAAETHRTGTAAW